MNENCFTRDRTATAGFTLPPYAARVSSLLAGARLRGLDDDGELLAAFIERTDEPRRRRAPAPVVEPASGNSRYSCLPRAVAERLLAR